MSAKSRPVIDLAKLNELTWNARRREAYALERDEALVREKADRKRRADELKAERIIAQIPGRVVAEALAGRDYAIVMALRGSDYERPREFEGSWNICHITWLKTVAHVVHAYCCEQGLRPTIEFWHDGVGIESGFNIVVHWSK